MKLKMPNSKGGKAIAITIYIILGLVLFSLAIAFLPIIIGVLIIRWMKKNVPDKKKRNIFTVLIVIAALISEVLIAYTFGENPDETAKPVATETADSTPTPSPTATPTATPDITEPVLASPAVNFADIPAYSGQIYVDINNGTPYFTENDIEAGKYTFELYSDLDDLGRCGTAFASINQELMPTEEREDISEVTPSGWNNKEYSSVDGGWLYNRCHLIGFQLTAENANPCNLITGTRSFNVDGMLLFENMVADYVKETNNHVLYRVTPYFEGNNLVASGVLMEGRSVEDEGDGIEFCSYVYNVQPGITINYANGDNQEEVVAQPDPAPAAQPAQQEAAPAPQQPEQPVQAPQPQTFDYVLNTNSMKFHYSTCRDVKRMSEANKQYYTGTRQQVLDWGYSPCGHCNP